MDKKLSQIGRKTMCPAGVFIKNKKILVGLRNYTPDKWKKISVWTCPGGRCDENETIETTLRREIKEETGITEFEILEFLGEVIGAKEGDFVPLFLCKTNQEPRLMEPNKFSEWRWVDFSEEPLDNFINDEVKKVILKFLSNKENFLS